MGKEEHLVLQEEMDNFLHSETILLLRLPKADHIVPQLS
jgi:hypothetical protein